jgi:hypothetical protein
MSKTIEVSEQDYARIRDAADADGMPLGEWVVANLPLEQSRTDVPAATPCVEPKTGRTMADRFAGRLGLVASEGDGHANPRPNGQTLAERATELGLVGVVNSGGAERLSERHSEVFGEMLEEQRRAGRL